DQKILKVSISEKDIIVKSKDKFRCKKLKVLKILTEEEIDKQLEKEFTEKFGQKGLWNFVKEFRNKKFLTRKFNDEDKKEIKKLLIKTNKKLSPYGWEYKDNVRFISAVSLGYSLWDSLGVSLGDSLWDSLWDSLRYSLR